MKTRKSNILGEQANNIASKMIRKILLEGGELG